MLHFKLCRINNNKFNSLYTEASVSYLVRPLIHNRWIFQHPSSTQETLSGFPFDHSETFEGEGIRRVEDSSKSPC